MVLPAVICLKIRSKCMMNNKVPSTSNNFTKLDFLIRRLKTFTIQQITIRQQSFFVISPLLIVSLLEPHNLWGDALIQKN